MSALDTDHRTKPFGIRKLTDHMAAEIQGLDLCEPLSDQTKRAVYQAFLDHQILVFRDQRLNKAQQVRFTEQFGTLERHVASNQGADDFPMVHVVSNVDANGEPTGKLGSTDWHTDKSFRPAPSMATVLHAVVLPPTGGDTCFANMYRAYEQLPPEQRARLDDTIVIHSWADSRANAGRVITDEERRDAPPMAHPIARPHPDTGRRALFLGSHAAFIEGMDRDTGRALIESLEAHSTQDQFVYRHQWQDGDLLMWDNRCLLHRADKNFDPARHRRLMHRTCLRGTPTSPAGSNALARETTDA
ncbi:MAG: TauD/TfdA family dioxygenase [Pseudomonadota bacterium]